MSSYLVKEPIPLGPGCDEGGVVGTDRVIVGEEEWPWLMVGSRLLGAADSLDILLSGLWAVVVRTAEGGGPATALLSSRVNCTVHALHKHRQRKEKDRIERLEPSALSEMPRNKY